MQLHIVAHLSVYTAYSRIHSHTWTLTAVYAACSRTRLLAHLHCISVYIYRLLANHPCTRIYTIFWVEVGGVCICICLCLCLCLCDAFSTSGVGSGSRGLI